MVVRVWMRLNVTKSKGEDDTEDGLCHRGYQTNLGLSLIHI